MAYPFLRLPPQKWVQASAGAGAPDEAQRRTRFCAPLKCVPYLFLRMTAPRRDSQRTRFCGNLFGSAVPVSARCSAETGTLYLQAASPSPWPIRLFTRRNRYGDQNAEPRGPRQTASSRVGFSDESSEFASPGRRLVEMKPHAAGEPPRRNRYAYCQVRRLEASTRFR